MTAEPGVLYAHACFEMKKGTTGEKHFLGLAVVKPVLGTLVEMKNE